MKEISMKADAGVGKEIQKLLFVPVSTFDVTIFSCYFYAVFWIALEPNLIEAIGAILIESLLMVITFIRPIQRLCAPASYRFLIEFAEGHPKNELDVLTNLVRLPLIKARHLTAFYFVKNMIFGTAIVVFWWEHPGHTNAEQFLRYFILELFVLSTFFTWVYVTGHKWASATLQRMKELGQFKTVLSNFTYPTHTPIQSIAFTAMILLGSLAMAVLYYRFGAANTISNTDKLQIGYIVSGVVVFISYQLHQILDLVYTQLRQCSEILSNFRQSGIGQLPISTISFIGDFQSKTNTFFKRLAEKERELSAWVFNEAEKERTNHIGAISALIAHDLAAPVTALKFCVDRVTNLQPLEDAERKHMSLAINHLFDLSRSLRNALRTSGDEQYSIHEAIASARSLVDIEFHKESAYKKLNYELALGDSNLFVTSIPKLYLIQVFTNLLKNSVRSMIESAESECNSEKTNKSIQIAARETEDEVQITFTDSGNSFSAELFRELTEENIFLSKDIKVRKGLGLRMSLRMIEVYRGRIDFTPPTPSIRPNFVVSIPKN